MCWGANSDGQLGISNFDDLVALYPMQVSFPNGELVKGVVKMMTIQ
jgi:hypothetical protein